MIGNISKAKAEKGDPLTFDMLTAEEKASLKGEKGDTPDLSGYATEEYVASAIASIEQSDWEETDSSSDAFIKNKPIIKHLGSIQSIRDLDNYNTLKHCGIYTVENNDYIWPEAEIIIIIPLGPSDFDINTPEIRQILIGTSSRTANMYRDYTYVSETEGQWSELHNSDYELKTELQPYLHSAEEIDNMIRQYARPVPVTPTIATVNLVANTSYNLTYLEEVLALNFPQTANDGDVIYVTFFSYRDDLTLFIDTTNTSDIDLIPEYNTGYEIYAKYNGSIWILGYSEYTDTNTATISTEGE